MSFFSNIERNVSSTIGLSISDIKYFSPEELRTHLEKRNNRKLTFVSEFPFIGRGNVLRNGIAGTREINRDVDKILGMR
jgi:hypothetical protein